MQKDFLLLKETTLFMLKALDTDSSPSTHECLNIVAIIEGIILNQFVTMKGFWLLLFVSGIPNAVQLCHLVYTIYLKPNAIENLYSLHFQKLLIISDVSVFWVTNSRSERRLGSSPTLPSPENLGLVKVR